MRKVNSNLATKIRELKNKGIAIIVAGVTIITGIGYALSAEATQVTTDKEVYLTDIMIEQNPELGKNIDTQMSVEVEAGDEYFDVFDDAQVYNRAEKIFAEVAKLPGLQEYTVEEIAIMLMIYGGRNPYNRDIQIADVLDASDRLTNIMDKESLGVAKRYRGFEGAELGALIPYSLGIPDGTRGQKQTIKLEEMRRKMLLSPTRDEALPTVDEFLHYVYDVYPTNGRSNLLGHDEVERRGYGLYNLNLMLNTANLAGSINPNAHVQAEVRNEDGTIEYCDMTIEELINKIISIPCIESEFDDFEFMVSYVQDYIFGTVSQAVNSTQYVLK